MPFNKFIAIFSETTNSKKLGRYRLRHWDILEKNRLFYIQTFFLDKKSYKKVKKNRSFSPLFRNKRTVSKAGIPISIGALPHFYLFLNSQGRSWPGGSSRPTRVVSNTNYRFIRTFKARNT
jgi:hypothetical protein